jgi:hypothetical protein
MSATRDRIPHLPNGADPNPSKGKERVRRPSLELRRLITRVEKLQRGASFQELGPRGRSVWIEIVASLGFLGFRPGKPATRIEANVLVAYCFRNGPLEDFHSSGRPIGQREMRRLMIFACRQLEGCLEVRKFLLAHQPNLWWSFVNCYHAMYCGRWSQG